jgi:hypothetical protein
MSPQLELLEAEALKLASADRALLAEHLIASLDEDNEIEACWAAEVKKRVAELDSGGAKNISLTEALSDARLLLNQ